MRSRANGGSHVGLSVTQTLVENVSKMKWQKNPATATQVTLAATNPADRALITGLSSGGDTLTPKSPNSIELCSENIVRMWLDGHPTFVIFQQADTKWLGTMTTMQIALWLLHMATTRIAPMRVTLCLSVPAMSGLASFACFSFTTLCLTNVGMNGYRIEMRLRNGDLVVQQPLL
jgi:hypothetical protein